MTLHAAIQQVLVQKKKALTASEIAHVLNMNNWYAKKDGSEIKSNQIGARVKNYPHLFNKANGLISLKSKTGIVLKQPKQVAIKSISKNNTLLTKVLLNKKNFKSVNESELKIPNQPGLYCIRVKEPKAFKQPFSKVLETRKHNIVYIGLASKSLQKRFLNQELRAKGHGTFFRSLGAVLGYTPEKGSLIGKSNQNNYKFSSKDELKIVNWINKNLVINWVTVSDNLNEIENQLIKDKLPLLNIAGNPDVLLEVTQLRNQCKQIARGNS